MGKPGGDGDETMGLLEEIETAFRRMIVGMFRFIFIRLPVWVYDLFQDFFNALWRFLHWTVRVSIKLTRVLLVASVWFALVFGPLIAALQFRLWDHAVIRTAGAAWAGIGIIGSLWGLSRWQRQRRGQAPTNAEARINWKKEVSCGAVLAIFAILLFFATAVYLIGWGVGWLPSSGSKTQTTPVPTLTGRR